MRQDIKKYHKNTDIVMSHIICIASFTGAGFLLPSLFGTHIVFFALAGLTSLSLFAKIGMSLNGWAGRSLMSVAPGFKWLGRLHFLAVSIKSGFDSMKDRESFQRKVECEGFTFYITIMKLGQGDIQYLVTRGKEKLLRGCISVSGNVEYPHFVSEEIIGRPLVAIGNTLHRIFLSEFSDFIKESKDIALDKKENIKKLIQNSAALKNDTGKTVKAVNDYDISLSKNLDLLANVVGELSMRDDRFEYYFKRMGRLHRTQGMYIPSQIYGLLDYGFEKCHKILAGYAQGIGNDDSDNIIFSMLENILNTAETEIDKIHINKIKNLMEEACNLDDLFYEESKKLNQIKY